MGVSFCVILNFLKNVPKRLLKYIHKKEKIPVNMPMVGGEISSIPAENAGGIQLTERTSPSNTDFLRVSS